MRNFFYRLHVKWDRLAWRFPRYAEWSAVWYIARHYNFPKSDIQDALANIRLNFIPGQVDFFGLERTDLSVLFAWAARRQSEESEEYYCVNGCCVVFWHNGRNAGGFGPAGCLCDNLKDPRGSNPKLVEK